MLASQAKRSSISRNPSATQLSTYLSQADSDDDDNSFKPPALSDYALELLKREKDSATRPIKDENTAVTERQQTSKRVNFRNSPDTNRSGFKLHHGENHHTLNTLNSEYETIFTKTGDYDSYGTTSTGIHERATQKTPLGSISGAESGSSHSSQTRLRSSTRRTRGFSGLGPPKRTLMSNDDPSNGHTSHDHSVEDSLVKDGSPQTRQSAVTPAQKFSTPQKSLDHAHASQSDATVPDRNSKIDFGGLNPYQYSRKHGIPSAELPSLVKIYFEQQKSATKEALVYNSPMRLKEVLHNKIEEHMRFADPETELFKVKTHKDPVQIYTESNKENEKFQDKNILSSIERSRSARRPLAPLAPMNESRPQQHPAHDLRKPVNYQQEQRQGEYQVRHYQQTEPLKAPDESRRTSKLLSINGKQYEKLELMGKGGSSKVFKVKSLTNKVYAIKKIVFDEFDEFSIIGFKGEIELLLKLRDQDRVVRLVDYALGQGSLSLVMECGDIDLSHVLAKRLDKPFDVEFVRFHANEVLKCVQAVHDAGIVHSDLKPANFLFVKGMLKIIDFGIANAVPEHTVNIYRESQIGTPNYMAPEALIDNNQQLADSSHHKSQWKVGKPSDIWSCGCIIYQMIYGRPPYGGYQGSQRLLAIMNPDVKIAYPNTGLGGVKVPGTAIATIQASLARDPSERWTAQEILSGPFLKPRVVSEQFVNDLVKNAITYGVGKTSVDAEELRSLAEDVWHRVSQLSL